MKKSLITVLLALLIGASSASAFDPRDLFGGSSSKSNSSEQSTGSSILNALGGIVSNATASDKFSVDEIVGSWKYSAPAIAFKSDNALQNIGGAAAATTIESKLEPYYKRLGFQKTSLEVAADHSFTLKLGVLTLQGTIEKDEQENLQFNFSAFGKVNLGSVDAKATKSGDNLNLTFDATRLIEILTKISSKLNNSTLTTIANLLNSYDGVYMGFKLTKA